VDPAVIKSNIERLQAQVSPKVDTGHPFLDLSVLTGLAHIDATFQGDHPKYGFGYYGRNQFDAFPPTILAAVDALSAWGLNARAVQLWRYWLLNMVPEDVSLMYYSGPGYGACIQEWGQLLHTGALLEERAGTEGWWDIGFKVLDRMAEYMLHLRREAEKDGGLARGAGDEDLYGPGARDRYFHTNAWIARGLQRWADLCERTDASPSTPVKKARQAAQSLADDTVAAIRKTWPKDPSDWWLSPRLEPAERPKNLVSDWLGSYANYRYYPELLFSGILPSDLANRVVEARLQGGGQFCGMTKILDWTDDWPLADYLYGLWSLGRKDDFLLSLYGHCAYQQDKDNLTVCEQLTFPPGLPVAGYCLPSQLVPARAARLLVK
jgi:hypothetical protein